MTTTHSFIYWLDRLVIIGAFAALAGCGGTAAERVALDQPSAVPFADMLPPVPRDAGGGHQASVAQTNTVNGIDSFSQSGGAMADGTGMNLPSAAGGIQWSIYRYMTGGNTPVSMFVDYTVHTGTSTWLGVADFVRGAWVIDGPYASGDVKTLSSNNMSPGGDLFFLVVTYDGTDTTVDSATITVDTGAPRFNISGTVLADGATPLAGVTMTLTPGGSTVLTDASGVYTFANVLDGDYTIAPSLSGYSFSPTSSPVTVSGAAVSGVDFTALAVLGHFVGGTVLLDGTTPLANVTMTLTPGGTTVLTNASGVYGFNDVADGSYTVAPSLANHNFTPTSKPAVVSGADVSGVDFSATAIPQSYSISGTVKKDGTSPLANVTMTLTPGGTTATTNASGVYTFNGVSAGSYTVTPSLANYNFTPTSKPVNVSNSNVTGVDFSATAIPQTHSVSGTVKQDGTSPLANVSMKLTPSNVTVTTNASGVFTFTGVAAGSYTVTPTLNGYTFTPASKSVNVSSADVTGVDFSAAAVVSVTYTNDIKPLLDLKCVGCHGSSGAAAGVQLQDYTHAKANASLSLAAIKNNSMPPGGPLTQAQKDLFQAWVDAGEPQ